MRTSAAAPLLVDEQVLEQRRRTCLERAEEIFEAGHAEIWLNATIRSLGRRTPISLLDTEEGYQLVLNTLGQIEGGVIS